MTQNKQHIGYALVLGTAIISGFSVFINKFAIGTGNPYIYTFLKNSITAILLCIAILGVWDIKTFFTFTKKQWIQLITIGVIGGGVPFLMFFYGLSQTSAAGASFIQKTMFIWVAILAIIFLKEKMTKNYVIAGLLILIGNLMFLKFSLIKFDHGLIMVFLATLFWSVENVLSKKVLSDIPPRIVMWARMFFGCLTIFAYIFFTGQASQILHLSIPQISWGLITGSVLLAYVATWYNGIRYIPVSYATLILALGSPITSLLSFVFIKPISINEYISATLIIIGVSTVLWQDKNTALIYDKRRT